MKLLAIGALALALAGCAAHPPVPAPVTSVTTPTTTASSSPVTTTATTALPTAAPQPTWWINPPTSSGIGKG